jgi:hypothetical protein
MFAANASESIIITLNRSDKLTKVPISVPVPPMFAANASESIIITLNRRDKLKKTLRGELGRFGRARVFLDMYRARILKLLRTA